MSVILRKKDCAYLKRNTRCIYLLKELFYLSLVSEKDIQLLFHHYKSNLCPEDDWRYVYSSPEAGLEDDKEHFVSAFGLEEDDLSNEVMCDLEDKSVNSISFLDFALGLDATIRMGKPIDKLRLLFQTIDHDSDSKVTVSDFSSMMIYHIPRNKERTMEGNMIEFYTRVKKYLPMIDIKEPNVLTFDECYRLTKEMKVLNEIIINPYYLVQGLYKRDKKKIHLVITSENINEEFNKYNNKSINKMNSESTVKRKSESKSNESIIEDRLSESDIYE